MFGEKQKFKKLRVFSTKSSFHCIVEYRRKVVNMIKIMRVLLKYIRANVHSCLL
jgi:hypothetical protein